MPSTVLGSVIYREIHRGYCPERADSAVERKEIETDNYSIISKCHSRGRTRAPWEHREALSPDLGGGRVNS